MSQWSSGQAKQALALKIRFTMFCFERGIGHNPWAEAFVLRPEGAIELSPGFQPWESSNKSDAP